MCRRFHVRLAINLSTIQRNCIHIMYSAYNSTKLGTGVSIRPYFEQVFGLNFGALWNVVLLTLDIEQIFSQILFMLV